VAGRLLYNAGRVATYGLIGVLFGLFGKTLALAGVQRWFSIGIGVLILAGLLAGRLESWSRPLAVPVARLKSSLGALLQRRSAGALLLIGLLNGLLPCGLVYVAAAGAITTGGILSAVEYMVVFGAGTVPMMLALSLAGGWLPVSWRLRFQRAVPVCVALVAVLLILRGLALGIPYLSPVCDLHGKPCCH
jgi:sulfite exporter TauE/SafE